MSIIKLTLRYLRGYPALSMSIVASMILGSMLEGASFGMLIPVIQSMTNAGSGAVSNAGFLQHISGLFNFSDVRSQLTFVLVALLFIIIVKNYFVYVSNVLIGKLRFTFTRDRNIELMNNLIDYDLTYFDRTDSGHLISVITNETRRMGDFIMSVLNFIALLVRVVVYVAILFLIAWKASVIIFLLIGIVFIPLELIMKKIAKLGLRTSQALSDSSIKLTEIINGIRLIKGSATEDAERRNFNSVSDRVCRAMFGIIRHSSLLIPLSESVIFALIVASFLVLLNVIKVDVTAAFPFVAVYLVVLVKTLTQLNTMNGMRSNAISNAAAFSAYEELLDKNGKMGIVNGTKKVSRLSDAITFNNVKFAYDPAKSVLGGISFTIPAGKVTAIVGASGAGKSTIVNLIMRFYDAQRGAVKVDGTDLRELELSAWRRMIGFVSQDVFIFNASVKDNLSYAHPEASREAVAEAAVAAGVDDFVRTLPRGYDTVLGERGVRLSGGQKQRVSIARAIISNPEILILDEATSSLDTKTERSIKAAIDRVTKDRTVIAIAHRLSTIVNADNIVVLENGIVAESGSHEELLKRGGLYKHFYDIQFNVKGICDKETADHA